MDGASLSLAPTESTFSDSGADEGQIGPNSVIQLGETVTRRLGRDAAHALYTSVGVPQLLDSPPTAMIDEAVPAALFEALWELFPNRAAALAQEAGRRTADYIITWRIPRIAQLVLRLCPRALAARLLLRAIHKNAWTFAGSGHCDIQLGFTHLISIRDNPLRMPDCAWHCGVLAQLFIRLVAPGTRVRHLTDRRPDIQVSRFEIILPEG